MTGPAGSQAWPTAISTITLFVEDLATTKAFYVEVFGLPVVYEDADSAVFRFGVQQVNLLQATAAPELVEPVAVAPPGAGTRALLTITVDDVDAMCAELARRG